MLNKRARWNLCFADEGSEADYENGQGRIIAFGDVPITNAIREELPKYLGEKARGLAAEGNYYYDAKKCYIGEHGDSERRKVVAVRLGETAPLYYRWYYRHEAVSDVMTLSLRHGDMYVMSEKAVGTDWKRSSIITLRHAAGSVKLK